MERDASRIGGREHRSKPHRTDRFVDEARLERDDGQGDRSVAADIAMHVARLADMERSWLGSEALSANDERSAAALDATDGVRLLHAGVRADGGPAERAHVRDREERLDDDGHGPIVAPSGLARRERPYERSKNRQFAGGARRYERFMIEGKVVAITGASSGIGEATARVLAAAGAKVVLGARRGERLRALAAELGGAAVDTDVTRRDDVAALVALALERFGKLDVFVGNAGIARVGPLDDLAIDDWLAMVDVNLNGFLYGIAAALPVFRRQGFGHFVTTISTAGLRVVPGQSIYAGTKNAVRTIHEGLRQEAGPHLRVTGISPGYVKTELATASVQNEETRARIEEQMAKLGIAPEAIARAIAFAIDQPADVDVGDIVVRPTAQG